MIRFGRTLLVVCMCLSIVGVWSSVASAEESLDDLVSGAISYVDKYESGRITYIHQWEWSPIERTDREIEDAITDYEQRLRSRNNLSEERISEQLAKHRAGMEKGGSRKTWTKSSVKCKYTFERQASHYAVAYEGQISHSAVTYPDGKVKERYFYNGNSTEIRDASDDKITSVSNKKLKEPRPSPYKYEATVRSVGDYGEDPSGDTMFHGPLHRLFQTKALLLKQDWEILDTKIEHGETVYVIESHTNSYWTYAIEIVPAKGYYIRERRQTATWEPTVFTTRFNNPTWNPGEEIYYPGEIAQENRSYSKLAAEERIYRETLFLKKVDLNIDIPESDFFVPMMEKFHVVDYRSKPSGYYSYKQPEELKRFLDELNGVTDPKPARSSAARRKARTVNADSPESRAFAGGALKVLNTAYPNSFDRVIVKRDSRLLIYVKEEALEFSAEILESIVTLAAATFQREFGTSNCEVLIKRKNGETLAKRSRYRRGKVITDVY